MKREIARERTADLRAERTPLVEEPYHFSSVLNDMLDIFRSYNQGKNLELVADCAPDIPAIIAGDSEKLTRAAAELLKGAAACDGSGKVYLKIAARKETYGINLSVTVRGAGSGISEARQLVQLMHGFLNVTETEDGVREARIVVPQKSVSDKNTQGAEKEFVQGGKQPACILDKERGVAYIGGDAEAYREIVRTYYKVARGKQKELKEAFEREDWKQYEIFVHALKSTSMSIGARQLAELAKEQELLTRMGRREETVKGFPELMECYQNVLEVIRTTPEFAIDGKRREGLWEITQTALLESLEELQKVLEEGKLAQAEEIEEELEQYSYRGLALSAELDGVREALSCVKLQRAAELTRELQGKVENLCWKKESKFTTNF